MNMNCHYLSLTQFTHKTTTRSDNIEFSMDPPGAHCTFNICMVIVEIAVLTIHHSAPFSFPFRNCNIFHFLRLILFREG